MSQYLDFFAPSYINGNIIYSSFRSQFPKADPYDWFYAPQICVPFIIRGFIDTLTTLSLSPWIRVCGSEHLAHSVYLRIKKLLTQADDNAPGIS